MASTAFNDITSPIDKPWDLSLKADQERWLVPSTASSNHVRFDVLVATATAFLGLLQDKSEYYRWGPLMSVPIDGDVLFDETPTTLSSGKEVMNVNMATCIDLLTHWTKVSTEHCQRFAQWFNGADDMKLDAPFGKAVDQTAVCLDCSPTDNIGLVRRYKVQLRIIDLLVLHVLKDHITTTSYKSFLAHKNDFLFQDEKTSNIVYSGLILLQKMLEISKPKTIVEVGHLKKQLDDITLWPEHENNVHQLTTKMMTILQEIHAKSKATLYTDQRFIANLFRALSSSPTEKSLLFIDQLKNQRIMEEITSSSDFIIKLDKMHKNMVADDSWVTMNKKDTKIVALALSFQEIWKRVGELAKRVSFSGNQKGGGDPKKKWWWKRERH